VGLILLQGVAQIRAGGRGLNPPPPAPILLKLTLILKVKIMYAVQNETEIKFNIVLYMLSS